MSEYQYVVFQAVDAPLNDKQLEFAQRQSTRADVSRWSLSVEYHYSSFRLLQKTAVLRAKEDAKQARKAQAKAKREAAKAERERADRMKKMLKDPDKWLREAERLVDARGTHNYKAAAEILDDLREAVGGGEGDKLARRHAAKLAKKHPTLNHLKSSLRKRGLLE